MANGILSVLSNVRKLSQGLFEGTQELYNPYTGKLYDDTSSDIDSLKAITYKVKPFVVSSEFLRLASSFTMQDKATTRATNSEDGYTELTEKETNYTLSKMAAVAHLYRLPYSHCWIEKETPYVAVSRTDPSSKSYYAVYLTEFDYGGDDYCILAQVFGYETNNTYGKMINLPTCSCIFKPSSLLSDDKSKSLKFYGPKADKFDAVGAGIVVDALGVILALNSPKIVSTTTEKMITKLANTNGNKKHVASDVIKVSVSKELRKQLNADKDLENEASRKGMRAHYVRGHFKVTRTGMFWWNAHIRGIGQPSEKTYELKP